MACLDSARLQAMLDGSLPPEQQAELSRHLDACTACQRALESLAGPRPPAVATLGRAAAGYGPALQRVLERLEAAEPPAAATEPGTALTLAFLQPSPAP